MGRGVGSARHPVQRDDRRDRRSATRLATACATTRDGPRREHGTGCETFRSAVGDDRALDNSETIYDRGAIDEPAAISDNESPRFADARTEPSAIEDTGALVRTGGRRSFFGSTRSRGISLRNRIEDGEPMDPDIRGDGG